MAGSGFQLNEIGRRDRIDSIDQLLDKEYDTIEEADNRMDLINSQFNDAKIFVGFKVMENYQN